jgi:lipoprotein signal peptidase
MLKELLKNAGLLVILAGVIVLGVAVFTKVQTNTNLAISLVLIIAGLLGHIVLNRLVE